MEKEIHFFKILEDLYKLRIIVVAISLLIFCITYFTSLNFFDRVNAKVAVTQQHNEVFKKINSLSNRIQTTEKSIIEIINNEGGFSLVQKIDADIFSSEVLKKMKDVILNKSLITKYYLKTNKIENPSLVDMTEMNDFINKFIFKTPENLISDVLTEIEFSSHKLQIESDINFLKNVISIANEEIFKNNSKAFDNFIDVSKSNIKLLSNSFSITNELIIEQKKKFIEDLKIEFEIAKSLELDEPANLTIEPKSLIRYNVNNEKRYSYVDGHIALGILIKSEEENLLAYSNESFNVFFKSNIEDAEKNLLAMEEIYKNNINDLKNIFFLDVESFHYEESNLRLIFSIIMSLATVLIFIFYISLKNAYLSYKNYNPNQDLE
ncbi:hypothetical protein OAJ23_02515 [Pelagibacteraceae bacterium]|nr:hypothetical protein [Pelagibacteraceae bacterium]